MTWSGAIPKSRLGLDMTGLEEPLQELRNEDAVSGLKASTVL